jgi:tetratricopeptide (TPR) repeat protein
MAKPSTRTIARPLHALPVLVVLVVLVGCAAPTPLDHPAMLYTGVDVCHRQVTTTSVEAQSWFDQGLTLFYGFNHDEATRSFHQATLLDPDCSMAWWGLAIASGPDLNDSQMSPQDYRRAFDAAQQAVATSAAATPQEQALAAAIATRYCWPPPEDREQLDAAYAAAMQGAWEAHPQDPEVATLYADSLMALQPWDYWTPEGEAKGRIEEAVVALEGALEITPAHAGACHFLVHALEAGDPKRAEAAADHLVDKVPGAGHLLHMPSHIFVHLGRYADASDVNESAIAADRAYFRIAPDPGFYILYHAHNLHMLAFSAMMEGREAVAMQAALDLERDIPAGFVREATSFVDGLMTTKLHVLVRFGHWEEILREPAPPAYRLLSVAQRHYARGVALSALGRTSEARVELVAFESAAAAVPEDWKVGANDSKEVLGLAHAMLRGELLWREGEQDEAFEVLQAGAQLEDQLVYDEPPGWMQPVRHAYGALLMAADHAARAAAVYREDLERNPGNGWSLLGLQKALAAQGSSGEAASVAADLALAWERSDVEANSSCFCEPGAS